MAKIESLAWNYTSPYHQVEQDNATLLDKGDLRVFVPHELSRLGGGGRAVESIT